MKKSTTRFSTQRWDNFAADLNAEDDDLILADLQTLPDDTGLTITPLNHIADDEDAIDRLLADSGFENPVSTAQKTDHIHSVVPDAAIDRNNFDHHQQAADPGTLGPFNDTAFTVEALSEEDAPSAETEAQISTHFQVAAFISDYLATRQPASPCTAEPEPGTETISVQKPGIDNSATRANNVKEPITQESPGASILQAAAQHHGPVHPAKLEQQLAQLQRATATATGLAYTILGISIASLLTIAIMYLVISDMKVDMAKLTTLVDMVKEDLENTHTDTTTEH